MITVEFRNALYYPTLYFGWDQRAECTQAHENSRVSTYSLLNDDRDDFFSTVQAVVECLSRAYHRVPVFLFEQTHACFCQKCPKQESFFHSRICLKIVLCRSFQNTSHTERAYIRQRYMECSYERHIDRTLADVGAELMAIFSIIFVNSLFLSPTSQHNYPATEVLYLLHHQPLPHLSVIKRCLHIRTNVFEWLPCIQPHTWTFIIYSTNSLRTFQYLPLSISCSKTINCEWKRRKTNKKIHSALQLHGHMWKMNDKNVVGK